MESVESEIERGRRDREIHVPSVVRLADDIARNLPHLTDVGLAEALALHIRSFWDPRMRAQLAEIVTADPGAFDPAVVAAVRELGAAPPVPEPNLTSPSAPPVTSP